MERQLWDETGGLDLNRRTGTGALPPDARGGRPAPASSMNFASPYARRAFLAERLRAHAADATPRFFSAPGRTELSGSHTDHSGGRVLAGAVTADILAAVAPTPEPVVRIESEGFAPFRVDLRDLAPRDDEAGTAASLTRGVAALLAADGALLGGFTACLHSELPAGAGLSSSAAFELLMGCVWNGLYNGGRVAAEDLAVVGRAAEQTYFGKPCGLMDQLVCALGGVVEIDFATPRPRVRRLAVDFAAHGLALVVVDTRDSHAGLDDEYAAIPADMSAAAAALGLTSLTPLDPAALVHEAARVRERAGDRALLRALHFVSENERVERQAAALERGDLDAYLADMRASGESSLQWLQNCVVPNRPERQGLAVALALTGVLLRGARAAWRVHGGGFGGSIQVLLARERLDDYRRQMDAAFGAGATRPLELRATGAGPLPDV
jgi:galactokinase